MNDELFIAIDKKLNKEIGILTKKHISADGEEHGVWCSISDSGLYEGNSPKEDALIRIKRILFQDHQDCKRVDEFVNLIHYDFKYRRNI